MASRGTAPECAPQHKRAPRPLPLFLTLIQEVARGDPALAARALEGLRRYQTAPDPPPRPERPGIATVGPATLRDHGGMGAPLVLVPSLINPPDILDLDDEVSLAAHLASAGHRVLLVDWGSANRRGELGVAGHVDQLLVPLIRSLATPPALVGYCLGGTMALAAAALTPVRQVATLAAPWHFAAYPAAVRDGIRQLFATARIAAEPLHVLPMEILQTGFWGLDPQRVVAKFAAFADAPVESGKSQRFIRLERWANAGEPLPLPAASELADALFGEDRPGTGRWTVGGRTILAPPPVPTLHLTARADRISPAAAAPPGPRIDIETGHVGLIVGRRGLTEARPHLTDFLVSSA